MRRNFLGLALCSSALLATHSLHAATGSREIDKRLLATWRSNKERTLKYWRYEKELDEEKRARFEKIFGKFTLRFTETHVHTEFEGETDVVPYTLVASDDSSVVIRWNEPGNPKLQQLIFDETGYHVLSGNSIEFFDRVKI